VVVVLLLGQEKFKGNDREEKAEEINDCVRVRIILGNNISGTATGLVYHLFINDGQV
jgi:hypothetical protein